VNSINVLVASELLQERDETDGLDVNDKSFNHSNGFGFQYSHNENFAMKSPKPDDVELYKTEMCRKWMETGKCKYGKKCQFGHGLDELRNVSRHQKVLQISNI
jgi:hypothetical protein